MDQATKGWRQRWFVLDTDELTAYKDQTLVYWLFVSLMFLCCLRPGCVSTCFRYVRVFVLIDAGVVQQPGPDSPPVRLTDCMVVFAPEIGKKNCFKVRQPIMGLARYPVTIHPNLLLPSPRMY